MLNVEFSSQAKRFLKKVDRRLTERLIERVERLREAPFPTDVKRVKGKEEKIFRVRVGDYRIQYCVFYGKNLLFITEMEKRPRAY